MRSGACRAVRNAHCRMEWLQGIAHNIRRLATGAGLASELPSAFCSSERRNASTVTLCIEHLQHTLSKFSSLPPLSPLLRLGSRAVRFCIARRSAMVRRAFYGALLISLLMWTSLLLQPAPATSSPSSSSSPFSPSLAKWSTYRPAALHSLRARVPHSPLLGFLHAPVWSTQPSHLVSEANGRFTYLRHDSRDSVHVLEDVSLNAQIFFHVVQHPSRQSTFVARISAKPLDTSAPLRPVSLYLYMASALDDPGEENHPVPPDSGSVRFTKRARNDVRIRGEHPKLGQFAAHLNAPRKGSVASLDALAARRSGPPQASAALRRALGDSSGELQLTEKTFDGLDKFFTASARSMSEMAWNVDSRLTRLLWRSGKDEQATKDGDELSEEEAEDKGRVLKLSNEVDHGAPMLFAQRVLVPPFEMSVTFVGAEEDRNGSVSEVEFERVLKEMDERTVDRLISERESQFDARFERTFGLRKKGVSEEEIDFAKSALSNVLGGIGFFHGSSLATDKEAGVSVLSPVSLLSATPSRAVFPRGFLWDEGFHQLIVQRWDPDLSAKCIHSWLEAMRATGWIPREQILGTEAQSRFPEHVQHLMFQRPDIANPPTLLMPLRVRAALCRRQRQTARAQGTEKYGLSKTCPKNSCCTSKTALNTTNSTATSASLADEEDVFLQSTLSRVTSYFDWLRETQAGEEEGTFRWRGRSVSERAQSGYPLTLASGLDDYPRAIAPSKLERHVDLHSWMTWAAGALAEVHLAAGATKDAARFAALRSKWIALLREKYLSDVPGQRARGSDARDAHMLCDYDGARSICHEGYVSMLPLLLGLLDPEDPLVGSALDALENEEILFAPAGIRSLAKKSQFYQKGDNYWTGRVWMPFNFLALASLKTKYSVKEGPFRERSEKLFHRLKKTILENAFRVYKETGFLWENYSPENGDGKSGRQFTGWSALVVLMYADIYEGVIL